MKSIKVIFTAIDQKQVKTNFTLDALNFIEAEIIANAMLGKEYAGGIIVLAQTWDMSSDIIIDEFKY